MEPKIKLFPADNILFPYSALSAPFVDPDNTEATPITGGVRLFNPGIDAEMLLFGPISVDESGNVFGTIESFELKLFGATVMTGSNLDLSYAEIIVALQQTQDSGSSKTAPATIANEEEPSGPSIDDLLDALFLKVVLDDAKIVGSKAGDLVLAPNTGTSGYGKKGSDYIFGGDGKQKLFGDKGNDYIDGRAGKDIYTGDKGKDTFVVSKLGEGRKKIMDFDKKKDTIALVDDAFGFDESMIGSVAKSAFTKGNQAKDESDRFIFNKNKGLLYFDSDGIGGADQVLIAKLSGDVTLKAKHLEIVPDYELPLIAA